MSRLEWLVWSIAALMLLACIIFTFTLVQKQNVNLQQVETCFFDDLAQQIKTNMSSRDHPINKISLLRDESEPSKAIESNLYHELNKDGISVISHNFIKDLVINNTDTNLILDEIPADILIYVNGTELTRTYDSLAICGKITVFSHLNKSIIYGKTISLNVSKSLVNPTYIFYALQRMEFEIRLILILIALSTIPFILSPLSLRIFNTNIEFYKMTILVIHIILGFMVLLFYLSLRINLYNSLFIIFITTIYSYFCYKYLNQLEQE
jgi:hypothetical protein